MMDKRIHRLVVCLALNGCSGADSDLGATESRPGENASEFEAENEEVGAVEQALSPPAPFTGTIHMGYNLVGYTWESEIAVRCPVGMVRDHVEIKAVHGAFSEWKKWKNPTDETDCSAIVVTSVQNGHWDDFEWKIFARRVNLAAGKLAIQSSDPFGGHPSRAVDGNTDGNWYSNSVTHTDFDNHAWWQVDLGTVYPLGEVVLYNRTDCCKSRLFNFDIKVSRGPDQYGNFNWSSVISYPNAAPPRMPFAMQTYGRFVRVELNRTDYLSLAEVEVFAP